MFTKFSLLATVCVLVCGAPALADTPAAPSMLGVTEIVLQFARISNSKAVTACGISREDISIALGKTFKLESMPVVLANDAKPANPSVARIYLFPEIASLNTSSGDCTSWVSLNAQSNSVAKIPPIEVPRNLLITYWRSGQLVSSGQSVHARIVLDYLQKLSRDFAKQYQVDQPPPLPNLEETATPVYGDVPAMKK